jgi:hypothetical protein
LVYYCAVCFIGVQSRAYKCRKKSPEPKLPELSAA